VRNRTLFQFVAQLDAAMKSITLPIPMKFRVLPLWVMLACSALITANAAVVFRPGDKAKYVPPGEEELSGDAAELFDIGQKAEKKGNYARAIKAYKTLVRKYSRDALAAGACYRGGVLYEKTGQYLEAAGTYKTLVVSYPTSPHFNEAIEGQFRVGEMYLAGKKLKLLGIPLATSMDRAVDIFASIIRTAPYGKYTARAQFDIGLAREKQGSNDAAIQAYQAVIDKFPNDPIAADAQYQIGYIWFTAAKLGTKDIAATTNARTAFQDFLFRYPNSEKAPQARANMQLLEHKSLNRAFDVARFYDKQKAYRAAVLYYNEVIRQQPGSAESEKAKKRIEQLRAKVGDKVLQSPLEAQEAERKQASDHEKAKTATAPASQSSKPDSAPMLPPDLNNSLPPAPSAPPLLPGGSSGWSSAPDSTPEPSTSATPESSSTPQTSSEPTHDENSNLSLPTDNGSPDATASPTP
jgi:outer membrane protein assembly factor BamD